MSVRQLLTSHQEGLSLLETIGAVFVILVGIVSVLALILTSGVSAETAEQQLKAANLGREAIEIVRHIRDSNWLRIEGNEPGNPQWNSFLSDGKIYTSIPEKLDGTTNYEGVWVLDFDGNLNINETTINQPKLAVCRKTETGNPGSYYFQYQAPGGCVVDPATEFKRVIHTDPICLKSDGSEGFVTNGQDCADLGGVAIGIRVKVEIQWQRNNQPITHVEEARLYDWK